ncbi:MAG: ABC transporter permease [Halobacteriota archaeon]
MSIKTIVSHSLWIAWKDITEIWRNRLALVMLVLMPLFMMCMVGFIFPSENSVNNVPVAVANLDTGSNTTFSKAFLTQLEAVNNKTGMMQLSTVGSADDVKNAIQNGDDSGGIIIGQNFSSDFASGKQADVTLVTDQSNPQMSALMRTALTQVIEQMGTQTAQHSLNATYKMPINATVARITPYNVATTGVVPGNPNYFEFVAPGMMAMVVMMSLMTGLPHAISYEREAGTLDGMLVAPVHRMSIIAGKVLAQTTRGMAQGFMVLGLAIVLFGVTINGNIALVIGLLLLAVFSFVGLGILITSFASTEETATMVMMTLMFPMMFLSGVFFPLQQMPAFMQTIAKFLPLTYAAEALRRVMVLGAGVPAIYTDIVILFGFGAVLLTVALFTFERAMSR